MAFHLPQLPYDYDALAPVVDAKTMKIHHTKHHQGYLTKLNDAIEGTDYNNKSIDQLLMGVSKISGVLHTAIRNHGGGYANHCLFWNVMTPHGKSMSKEFEGILEDHFGSIEDLRKHFFDAATGQFGSGWAWIVKEQSGALAIVSTPNQDSPLSEGKIPLLGIDVWEHAYYLSYQNKRADYVKARWNIVNWEQVENNYRQA